MKYSKKLEPILEDLSNKEIDLAGGSMVGMVLSTTNALVDYICNLTIGKKKYADVQDEVIEIQKEAKNLKKQTLDDIDKDRDVLEKILITYKKRKEDPKSYEEANKEAVKFCINVTKNAVETLELVYKISRIGNKMLTSDFTICKYYGFASVESSIVNVEVNLEGIQDKEFCEEARESYKKYYELAKNIMSKF